MVDDSQMTSEQRREQCLKLLRDRKKFAKCVIEKKCNGDECDWCGTHSEGVDTVFANQRLLMTVCCEAKICIDCLCAGAEVWYEKQSKSLMPCLVCGRKCIAEGEFSSDHQDPNYLKKCGSTALYWVQMGVMRFQKRPKNAQSWFEKRKNLCEWLSRTDRTILPGCLSWRQEDSRYTAVYNAVTRCVAPAHESSEDVDVPQADDIGMFASDSIYVDLLQNLLKVRH